MKRNQSKKKWVALLKKKNVYNYNNDNIDSNRFRDSPN